MKRRHFERFRPVCPVCQRRGEDVPLELRTVVREVGCSSGGSEERGEIPPGPPLEKGGDQGSPPLEKGGESESPPFVKGDLGGFLGNENSQSAHLEKNGDGLRLRGREIPPGPPLEKGGESESPPFLKGDLGGFLGNENSQSAHLEKNGDGLRLRGREIPPGPPLEKGGDQESPPFVKGDLGGFSGDEDSTILEGVLTCADPACMAEYPIIDGIPIIVADVRGFVARNASALLARSDLSDTLESLVGDCCGPQSDFDVRRQHLGSYAYDHYGDLDPEEATNGSAPPGSILRLLREGLDRVGEIPAGPILDAGCAVGRTSFALAEATDDLVLGVDLNLDMLRVASRALHQGVVRYPRRRIGMVYDRREFPVSFPAADRVDFWACDAGAIPAASRTFGLASSLNLLDCMNSPLDHLREIGRILAPGGRAILATPYDWSPNATPVEAWIGGHSQRSSFRGAAEPLLRHLLSQEEFRGADGLEIVTEASLPWSVRVHDRAAMTYQSHLMILRKGAA